MRLLRFGATWLGVLPWLAYIVANPIAIDAHAYFVARPGSLYALPWGTADAYVYSPAFSQAIEPLRWLGWDGFRSAWRLIELAALTAITGPLTGPLLFVTPVALEINLGNVNLLLAAAVLAGFRYPAAWAFVLLTKVTPGVGLLWFAARREWRNLAIAVGTTVVIAAASVMAAPDDWLAWLRFLADPPTPDLDLIITLPLSVRVISAACLVWWGARTDRPWTVLVAAFLAMPSVWLVSATVLVGLFRRTLVPSGHGYPVAGPTPDPGPMGHTPPPSTDRKVRHDPPA